MQYYGKCIALTKYFSSTIPIPQSTLQSTLINPPLDGCCHSKSCSPTGDNSRFNVSFHRGRDSRGWVGIWTSNSLHHPLYLLSHSRTPLSRLKRSLFILTVLGILKRKRRMPGRVFVLPCCICLDWDAMTTVRKMFHHLTCHVTIVQHLPRLLKFSQTLRPRRRF